MAKAVANLFPPPPTIDLDGLRLRPLRPTDAEAVYAYLREPLVTDLTSYPVASLALAEAIIERSRNRWAAGEPAKWGVCLPDDDRPVGTCGFNEWSATHRWAELAYELAPAHWGRGLMGRAVAEVVGWAFRHDLIDRVQAFVRVDNERSARLLERAGFVREGRLRGYRPCRGRRYDFYIYGLLRSDRPNVSQPKQAEPGAAADGGGMTAFPGS